MDEWLKFIGRKKEGLQFNTKPSRGIKGSPKLFDFLKLFPKSSFRE